jgi:hypothetical protein
MQLEVPTPLNLVTLTRTHASGLSCNMVLIYGYVFREREYFQNGMPFLNMQLNEYVKELYFNLTICSQPVASKLANV